MKTPDFYLIEILRQVWYRVDRNGYLNFSCGIVTDTLNHGTLPNEDCPPEIRGSTICLYRDDRVQVIGKVRADMVYSYLKTILGFRKKYVRVSRLQGQGE